MVAITFNSIINIIAQTFFDGSTTIAGLVIMLAAFFIALVVLANVKAPPVYSLVPMMILSIIFTAYGVMDTTVSFLIIILSAVMTAAMARKTVGGV